MEAGQQQKNPPRAFCQNCSKMQSVALIGGVFSIARGNQAITVLDGDDVRRDASKSGALGFKISF